MKIIISESQFKKIVSIISESEEDDSEIDVLFVGDSLSAGPGYTWNYLMAKNHPNWNVTHNVKGGRRVKGRDGMLENLSMKLDDKSYDKVFIYGGTNDMFSGISDKQKINESNINSTVDAIQTMVNMIRDSGGVPYVFIGYDAETVMPTRLVPTRYCDEECMVRGRDNMIEFQKRLKRISNAVIIPAIKGDNSWTSDSTHPHGWAHKMMADHVERYMDMPSMGMEGKTKEPDSFFEKLKRFIQNPSEFMFGPEEKMKKSLISSLENLNERVKTKKHLTESVHIEYDGEVVEKPIVKYLQIALQLLGFQLPQFGVDGKFGPETESAVKRFKKKFGLDDDGIIDNKTKEKLITVLKDKKIPDDKFKDVQIEKTKNYTSEDFDSFDELMGNSRLTSSTLSKFKQVLDDNDLSYDDFASKVKSIGLDPEIAVQQLSIESIFFNPKVIDCTIKSPMGAMGIAQFIPAAWSSYGKGSPCEVPNALDAYVKLMDYLLDKFEGRVDLALAGYNSGPYRKVYTNALANSTPFSKLKGQVPAETWGYVNKIIEI